MSLHLSLTYSSPNLENAIDDLVSIFQKEGFENVRTEPVQAPHWVRGEESLEMLEPRYSKLQILGLGGSIGTGKEGITAEAVVVTSFDELSRLGEQVRGKIVVYAVPWQGYNCQGSNHVDNCRYGQTVQYRVYGASHAAKYGAVAALVGNV
jgi:carboxypeptidase Q